MAKLTDIKNKFNTSRISVGGIPQYIFDNLSEINSDKQQDYPALLLKPPVSNYAAKDKSVKDWQIDFFLFDLWLPNGETELRTLEQVWEALEDKGMAIIADILSDRPTYGMVNMDTEPKITLGYPFHNDRLVGVRFQFTLRAWYACKDNV